MAALRRAHIRLRSKKVAWTLAAADLHHLAQALSCLHGVVAISERSIWTAVKAKRMVEGVQGFAMLVIRC